MSGRASFREGFCPGGLLSGRAVVREGCCPGGLLSGRAFIREGFHPEGLTTAPTPTIAAPAIVMLEGFYSFTGECVGWGVVFVMES